MIAKIGFVMLVLISCGTLYMLDFYIKQDQEENSKQLHSFVQQTRDIALAKTSAKERFESQLVTDLARCQDNALKAYNNYLGLIRKSAHSKHGAPAIPEDILRQAVTLQTNQKNDCKNIYDTKIREGI
jgi:hypothetical protein